jgi:hypothetical protein
MCTSTWGCAAIQLRVVSLQHACLVIDAQHTLSEVELDEGRLDDAQTLNNISESIARRRIEQARDKACFVHKEASIAAFQESLLFGDMRHMLVSRVGAENGAEEVQ